MGRWMMNPFKSRGLQFQKMMGSGRQFGLMPNWSTYVFLAVWDTEKDAAAFFESPAWSRYINGTEGTGTLWLRPYRSHGKWDGQNPFTDDSVEHERLEDRPVAVLTRATIRFRALLDFWRHVPQARKRLQSLTGDLLFSIGVGEKPVVQQCTFSVWRDEKAVEQFAYRQAGHREVVRRTRQKQWYREELFARMSVWKADGLFSELLAVQKQTTPP